MKFAQHTAEKDIGENYFAFLTPAQARWSRPGAKPSKMGGAAPSGRRTLQSRSSPTTMKLFYAFLLLASSVLTGCAHPISITPNLAALDQRGQTRVPIEATVGFYISPKALGTEVTTGGGGGDSVRYYPYRDIEAGFQKMLQSVFLKTVRLTSPPELDANRQQAFDYLIVPELVTTSGGSGFFTWEPTNFTIDLAAAVRDKTGSLLSTLRVVGSGASQETIERFMDDGIAGRRAMEDALVKMQQSLSESNVFKARGAAATQTQTGSSAAPGSTASRLLEIKTLRDGGQITAEEYEAKRRVILDSL